MECSCLGVPRLFFTCFCPRPLIVVVRVFLLPPHYFVVVSQIRGYMYARPLSPLPLLLILYVPSFFRYIYIYNRENCSALFLSDRIPWKCAYPRQQAFSVLGSWCLRETKSPYRTYEKRYGESKPRYQRYSFYGSILGYPRHYNCTRARCANETLEVSLQY